MIGDDLYVAQNKFWKAFEAIDNVSAEDFHKHPIMDDIEKSHHIVWC